ncbi:146_t:CDS:2, partial [Gigaspora margarita]
PKFDKTYIYKLPKNKYQKFSNVYAYSFMVKNENPAPSWLIICDVAAKEWQEIKKLKNTEINNIIKQYYTTPLKLQSYFQSVALSSRIQVSDSVIDNLSHIITLPTVHHVEEIRKLENIYNITTDTQLYKDLLTRISDLSVTGVSHDETKDYLDEHYCLASVKGTRQFAQAFLDSSIIISQDNKAKIGLGVPAVGRTFCTLQSVLEPVQVPDHDFVYRINQKLIPLVYFIIKPSEINDNLRTRQMAIFVRSQWSIGTSSITHVKDISSLVSDDQYSGILKINNNIKPIWILLSKYNPVERVMSTLSGKLAKIVLPINHFGNYLDSQGKIIDTERPKKKQPKSSESVVEFVLISNSAEIENFGILLLEQNRQDFFSGNNFRDCASDLE